MSIRSLGDIIARTPTNSSVSEDATIFALAQTLSDARADAVAVLSTGANALVGIATSRDVAKCIARGEDLLSIKVSEVMTAHPITLPPTESPANALSLMREGGFRHIPVVSEENGNVLGIVDVLSLAYDAIARLQVSYSMIPSRRGFEFMRAARETIEKPTLRSIVERSPFATLTSDSTVTHACETVVREHLASIVIVDSNGVLDGIFTCRDVVNRVVAKGLDPITTPLSHVMTVNPDCAGPDFTVLESLQRMQACGFRHLPVVEDQSRAVIGLVNVLQLAADAISGLESVAENSDGLSKNGQGQRISAGQKGRGLARIFGSLFGSSYAPSGYEDESRQVQPEEGAVEPPPPPSISFSGSSSLFAPPSVQRSMATNTRRHYSYLGGEVGNIGRGRGIGGDVTLASFKFKDMNNEYRRIKVPVVVGHGVFDQFVLDVRRRFAGSSSVGPIKIKYVDEDSDEVLISNDEDLASCFEDFAEHRNKTILLKVYQVERPSSSQIQSPVSSNASSLLGSPRRPIPPAADKPDPQPLSPPSAELPKEHADTHHSSMTRAGSRPVIQAPSALKANEAHQQMLDGKHDEAIRLYDKALELDRDNARAQGGRGAARLFSGDSTGAEEDYRAAIAMLEAAKGGAVGDLTFQMCVVGLVESLIDQRRYEEAVAVAGRVDSSSGNTGCADAFRDELDSAGNAAREALEAGEYGDAMSCYSNALRVEAAYLQLVDDETARASLRLGRAKCYKALEDYDMALEDYEAAVILEPESVAGHKGCGKCLAELEQMDRALEAYERAHTLDPADDEVNREISTVKSILPDPLKDKKDEISKLGALLGGMNLPGKPT